MRNSFTIGSILLTLLLTACKSTPTTFDDPIAAMADKSLDYDKRWDAIRQAESQHFNDPKRIKTLQKLVWVRGYPPQFSNYAVDELLKVSESDAKQFLSTVIVLINDWETRNHVINIAVKRKWTDFVPALVRSYAQRTVRYTDPTRPERAAILTLAPNKTIPQTVLHVLNDDKFTSLPQRAAAWQLLYRLINDRAKVQEIVLNTQAKSPLLKDLQYAVRNFGVLPTNRDTIVWMMTLRSPDKADYWSQIHDVKSQLTPAQSHGLELRHLPLLLYVKANHPELLTRSTAALTQSLKSRLAAQKHHLKGPNYDGPSEDYPQQFVDWQSELTWPDILTLHVMLNLMADRSLTATFFKQADEDLKDKLTEYGGLIRVNKSSKAYIQKYDPTYRHHDLKYLAPRQLVIDGYTALFHYHFHAQEYKNKKFAGPGIGDRRRVGQTLQFNGIVLTFIDKNSLNVDYYQPRGVVVDLGTIYR